MKRKLTVLLFLSLFMAISVLEGCSSGKKSESMETTITENTKQEQLSQENQSVEITETAEAAEAFTASDEEVLFDFYSIPADWPGAVPLHTEMKVTKYERTEISMNASGFCTYDIFGLNNFYTNARKEVGGGYPWDFDPEKESVTEGSEQVFYYVSEDGKSLTIKFSESEEKMLIFDLSYKE